MHFSIGKKPDLQLLADRRNGRAYVTVLRQSVAVVCLWRYVLYCG